MNRCKVFSVLALSAACATPVSLFANDNPAPTDDAAQKNALKNFQDLQAKIAAQQKALADNQAKLATMKAALVKQGAIKAPAEVKPVAESASEQTATKASDQPAEKPQPSLWKGTNIGFGATINTGDNSSQKLNGVLNLKYAPMPWVYTAKFDPQYQHTSNDGVTTDKFNVQGQASYFFTDKNFVYNSLIYTYDRFDGNDYLWNYSIGYGRVLYQGKSVTITGQAGPGYQQRKIQDTGKVQRALSVNAQGDLSWQINDKTVFTQMVAPTYTHNFTTVRTSSALTTQLMGNLSLQLQFDTSYQSNVESDARRFNTITSCSILYNFA